MTLWNLIRDFFVNNIFGGWTSTGSFVGNTISYYGGSNSQTSNVFFTIDTWQVGQSGAFRITIGDWLSTSFTIITLILLVIFLYIFVKWIFKLFAGLLR